MKIVRVPPPAHEEYEESSYLDDVTTTEGWGRRSMSVAHGFGEIYRCQAMNHSSRPRRINAVDQWLVGRETWDRADGDSAPPSRGRTGAPKQCHQPPRRKGPQKPVEVVPASATRCARGGSRLGRTKRSDIRMAWREKITIRCADWSFFISLLSRLICPEFNKAWSLDELKGHTTDKDFWVSVRGKVYNITLLWKGDHGTTQAPLRKTS